MIKRLVTHSGAFHADDVLVGALFMKLVNGIHLVRTRDPKVLAEAKEDANCIVYDVGGEHSDVLNNFDHHQQGGAGARNNGVPFSSFGLVWDRFGLDYCEKVIEEQTVATGISPKLLADEVDIELVQGIDAIDCGAVKEPRFQPKAGGVSVEGQTLSGILFDMNPQPLLGPANYDAAYVVAVGYAATYLRRFVESQLAKLYGRKLIAAGRRIEERIVVVDGNVPDWSDIVSGAEHGFEEALFYLEPDGSTPGAWMIWQVPTAPRVFTGRKQLPQSWAGLRGEALEAVCGVPGANFCHGARFVGGGKTLEATIAMAKAAIAA